MEILYLIIFFILGTVLGTIYTVIGLKLPNNEKIVVKRKCKKCHHELSIKEKKKVILEQYKLTEDMYQIIASVVASESKANSYDDAYAVINTIYNRTLSKRWVNHINNIYGSGKGKNLYYQTIAPNQFTVYSSGSYKKYINNIPKTVEEAVINLLYTEESLHNYLSFRSSSYKGANTVQYEKGGNKYFNEQKKRAHKVLFIH